MYRSFMEIQGIRERLFSEIIKQIDVVTDESFKEFLDLKIRDAKEQIENLGPESVEARGAITELGVLSQARTMVCWMIDFNKEYTPKGDYIQGARAAGTGFSNSLYYTEKKGFYEVKRLYGKSESEVVLMSPAEIKKIGVELDFLKFYMQVKFKLDSYPPYYSGSISLGNAVSKRIEDNAATLRQIEHTLKDEESSTEKILAVSLRKEYFEYLALNDLSILANENEKIRERIKDMSKEEKLNLVVTF